MDGVGREIVLVGIETGTLLARRGSVLESGRLAALNRAELPPRRKAACCRRISPRGGPS